MSDRDDYMRARDALIGMRRLRLNGDERILALGLLSAIEKEMPEAARSLAEEAEQLLASREER